MSLELFFVVFLVVTVKAAWPRRDWRPPLVQEFIRYVLSHGDPLPPWLAE